MRKQRIFGVIVAILLLASAITVRYLSMIHWNEVQFNKVDVSVQFPDNQTLVFNSNLQPVINTFLEEQGDSNALKVNAFLLETSLEALPYVADAQVYWNMDQHLKIVLVSKQVKAIVMIGATTFLVTTENEVLKKPVEAIVDVPVITGVQDSSEAAAAGVTLSRIYLSQVFNDANLAQLDHSEDHLAIVPKGYNHTVLLNSDERLKDDLNKLAAFYAANTPEKLDDFKRIDLRYKNQVVSTTR
jgi:cell division septal protein FtsQ